MVDFEGIQTRFHLTRRPYVMIIMQHLVIGCTDFVHGGKDEINDENLTMSI
jgi:hypothetical protein